MDSKETKQAVTALEVSDAASKETPAGGENPSGAGNQSEKKSGHGTLKLILSFVPSVILILAGLRMKWLMRGTALLFMDSTAGKRLSGWWILIALGVVIAVMIPIIRAAKKKPGQSGGSEKNPDSAPSGSETDENPESDKNDDKSAENPTGDNAVKSDSSAPEGSESDENSGNHGDKKSGDEDGKSSDAG